MGIHVFCLGIMSGSVSTPVSITGETVRLHTARGALGIVYAVAARARANMMVDYGTVLELVLR